MRSSSALTRFFLGLISVAAASCASPKPGPPAAESSITLEGEISLSGTGPLDERIVLADAGGSFCTLRNPRLELEMRSLAGQRVRVTGHLIGKTSGDPEFLVESYALMPTNGRQPIIGTAELRGGEIVLVQAGSQDVYRLGGPLAEALRNFAGFKVWVSGVVAPALGGSGGPATLAVESYGVLVPATGTANREP